MQRKHSVVSTTPFSLSFALDIWQACKDGQLDTVRIMLREGEDKNLQTQNLSNTPLHIAARNNHYLISKYLIDIEATVHTKNAEGLTPKEYLG